MADPDAAAQAVIDALAALPPASLRGRNVFTAWLGEQMAAPARRRFEAAGIPTYDALSQVFCTAPVINGTKRC